MSIPDLTVNAGLNAGEVVSSPCDNTGEPSIPSFAIATACPLNDASVGVAYSNILSAIGGTLPYYWDLDSGALPTGLTLSTAGVISGVPTVQGLFTFVLRVTGMIGGVTTKSCQITVAQVVITSNCPLTDGNVGDAYSVVLAAVGGTPPYTWSITSGALPDGLALSAAGVITGTPTSSQVKTFTLKALDTITQFATKSCQITVTNVNALVYTNTFSEAATAHASQDLGLKLGVTSAPGIAINRTGCNITHDTDGMCLHADYIAGNGTGGVTATADMTYAVGAINAQIEDSDQLAQAICVADNSSAGSITRSGPAVCMSGTWNNSVPAAYYFNFKPEVSIAKLTRITGSLGTETELGSNHTANLNDILCLTVKDNGASIRIRLWINNVMVEEVTDSSASRIHVSGGAMGFMVRFVSAPQYTKWTPLVCAIQR